MNDKFAFAMGFEKAILGLSLTVASIVTATLAIATIMN